MSSFQETLFFSLRILDAMIPLDDEDHYMNLVDKENFYQIISLTDNLYHVRWGSGYQEENLTKKQILERFQNADQIEINRGSETLFNYIF